MGLFDKLKQTVEDVPRAVPAASEQTTEVVFPKLPDTLEAFKALPQAQLSTPSDTAALTVLALCFYPQDLDMALMQRAAKAFEGTHDFRGFAGKVLPCENTVKILTSAGVFKENDRFVNNQIIPYFA